jgi:carboxylate-amine ligase
MGPDTFFSKIRKKRSVLGLKSKTKRSGKERSKTGFEVEFLIVDNEGNVSNEADNILDHIKENELKHEAVRECSHSYIEMGVYPAIYVRNVATKFLNDMLGVLDVAEKFDLGFYPMAMYPYEYTPKMRTEGWYGVKEKIFGEKWEYAGRCAGFHFHYSLPSGIFSYDDRHLVENARRSEKQKTINSYNFGIAADPVLTTLTQSSPLFMGKHLAKGSRIPVYRGGDELDYDGYYSDYQEFGALQDYIVTYEELIERSEDKHRKWMEIVKRVGGDVNEVKKKNKLDISWNPVKVNKVGSIELRNMDMNFPSTLMAVAILMKYVLRDIQRREIEVVPDKRGIAEPFSYEEREGRKVIFVPPFWYVNSRMQHDGAWEGLENKAVYDYCRGFWNLCLKFVNKKYYPALKPVKKMIKSGKTRSDEILEKVRKAGYDPKQKVPDEALKGIVLEYSKKLRRDIEDNKELMENLTEGMRAWL